jgi:hypothetical protein
VIFVEAHVATDADEPLNTRVQILDVSSRTKSGSSEDAGF